MKSQQQHVSEDDPQTIVALNSRASKSVNGGENSDAIPVDLIFEILLKLPTKSIARCRCVSKLWSSILVRPDFTELFLTRSTTPPQVLFSSPNNRELFFFTAPQVQNPDQNSSLVSRPYHTKPPFDCCSPRICVPVGGLVCLIYKRNLEGGNEIVPMICKPSTGRQALPLPALKTTRVQVKSFFVYDPIGKLFKVLLSMILPCHGNEGNCKECQILTLGTQTLSWRKIDCCIPHRPIYRGICIDGCLYYQALVDDHRSGVSTIVCFDVRSETFRFVKKDIAMSSESTLVNYEGRLGALQSDRGNKRVNSQTRSLELWVLVDAEKNEWSNNVYDLPPLWKNIVPKAELCFVGLTSTNDIVLSERNPFDIFWIFYYNLERHTIIKVEIQGMDVYFSYYHRVQTYLNV
ncbi:PREDICTED: putative F-box protein At2g19630 [Camelina sativa]|uniref:F-box protein At2g19630 n=1 Tax=Camelina sativa TaxID=90675 RepID=A0ABM0ZB91_CAMSA|nr:PREDICTED: putative F-box protein At2g19630 [Camelina sativa]